jgi:hypothetical protein
LIAENSAEIVSGAFQNLTYCYALGILKSRLSSFEILLEEGVGFIVSCCD